MTNNARVQGVSFQISGRGQSGVPGVSKLLVKAEDVPGRSIFSPHRRKSTSYLPVAFEIGLRLAFGRYARRWLINH
jgi:hypothetical protein